MAKGDRIAVLARNGVDFARLFFGAARAGAVLVTLSARDTAAEFHRILDRTGARLLFHDDALDAGRAVAIPAVRFGAAFERFARSGGPDAGRAVLPDDPLCMTFTGGTTGAPRGVLVSHRSRCAVAAGVAAVYQRHEFLEERKTALIAWGNYVQSLVARTGRSNVVNIYDR